LITNKGKLRRKPN